MISIVLSTYNRAHTLKETIDSILNQTYSDFELIIVDDGSTDATQELLAVYKDTRIRSFCMEENRFYCVAANWGIEHAKGDYIAFATSDDTWEPEKLELQMNYMEARQECGCCFTFADMIDENGKNANDSFEGLATLLKEKHYTQKDWVQKFFFDGNCLCHPSALVRKNVMDDVGNYNLLFCQSADMELWLRIVRKYPIHIIEKPLVHYRCYRNPEKQISGVDELKTARWVNEHMMIRRDFMDTLSDEEVVRFFSDKFRNPDSASHQEIEIEKAFLLMNCSKQLPEFKLLGVEKFEKLLHNPDILNVLKEKYHTTIHDIYKWNLGHYYVDYGVSAQLEDQKQRIAVCQEELRKEKEITQSLQKNCSELMEEINNMKEQLCQKENSLIQLQQKYIDAERKFNVAEMQLQETKDEKERVQEELREYLIKKLQAEESKKIRNIFKK